MSLEVVCGPMFSGKSSYIYSVAKRYSAVGIEVLVLKPTKDTRYSVLPEVVTHDGIRLDCLTTSTRLMELDFEFTKRAKLIIIEEAQFYEDLTLFVKWAVETEKKNVVVVGLDGDYERKPFGQVLDCIPLADKVTKLTALCTCSKPAPFTKRKASKHPTVFIGGTEMYTPQCRECYMNN